MDKTKTIKPKSKRKGEFLVFPPNWIESPETKKKSKKKKFQYF